MLIDTHVHLDAAAFATELDAVVARALALGVERFIIPAVSVGNFSRVHELSMYLPHSACAYGIHPLFVSRAHECDLETLRSHLMQKQARVCAVGEIGLDASEGSPDLARQEWFFSEQLKLAKAFDLPVIIHSRRAQDRVLKYLRRFKVRGGIAHAFNGSLQQATAFIALGFKLGFGGAMTYSGSLRIRKLAATLPLESIVLESDAPDIAPAWATGKRNEPANVARFAQVLATLRQETLDHIIATTAFNSKDILNLSK